MSSGLECEFFEPMPGRWYYALQNYSCPAGAWDWREHAACYGPFATYEDACEHLSDNHANPGGHMITETKDYRVEAVYSSLISEARLRLY